MLSSFSVLLVLTTRFFTYSPTRSTFHPVFRVCPGCPGTSLPTAIIMDVANGVTQQYAAVAGWPVEITASTGTAPVTLFLF